MATIGLADNLIEDSIIVQEPAQNVPFLTKDNIKYLQESWKVVESEPLINGKKIFHRLFEQNPWIMKKFYFATRYSCDIVKIMEDKKLESHAENVVKTVTLALNHIEDLGTLIPVLLKLGGRHANFNPQEDDFKALGEALIYVIQCCHSDNFNNDNRLLWVKIYGIVSQTMMEGIRKERDTKMKK